MARNQYSDEREAEARYKEFLAQAELSAKQMAEDTARALDNGASPSSLVAPHPVDIAKSLAAFLIVVDRSGQSLASSADLHGQVPIPPSGVLETARRTGANILTWQPEPGVRIASVTVPYRDGYVVAGRSLRAT